MVSICVSHALARRCTPSVRPKPVEFCTQVCTTAFCHIFLFFTTRVLWYIKRLESPPEGCRAHFWVEISGNGIVSDFDASLARVKGSPIGTVLIIICLAGSLDPFPNFIIFKNGGTCKFSQKNKWRELHTEMERAAQKQMEAVAHSQQEIISGVQQGETVYNIRITRYLTPAKSSGA